MHNGIHTSGPVEDMELLEIRTHVKTGCVMVHSQHVLSRVAWIQE